MDKVSVLLASSHSGVRLSLRQVLENEGWIKVVGTPACEADALQLARTLAPQVVIIDFDLTDDSIETGRRILEMSPDAKIIVLSLNDYTGRGNVRPALRGADVPAGSVEWLSKDSGAAELISSIATLKRRRFIQ